MKPSAITATLEALHKIPTPVYLWGPPGTGKSSLIRQYAARHGKLWDVRAALLEAVDLRGLPIIDGSRSHAVWLPPNFLPKQGETGVLFLDELAQAPVAVHSACLSLCLDRRIGEYVLPDGVKVVAASNRIEDRAGANRVNTALSARFLHLDLEVSVEDWVEWAMEEGLDSDVISFVNFKGGAALHNFNAAERQSPNPRSWEFVSKALPHIPEGCEFAVVQGYVGSAAGEFLAFRRHAQSLPDPMGMLNNPHKCKIPSEPSVIHALIGRLLDCYRNEPKVSDGLFTIFERLEPEFGFVGFRGASQIRKEAVMHPICHKWWQKNIELTKKK